MPPEAILIPTSQIRVTKSRTGLNYSYRCPKCKESLVSKNDDALAGDTCPMCSLSFTFNRDLQAAWRKFQEQLREEEELRKQAENERRQKIAEQRAAASQQASQIAAAAVSAVRSQFDAVRQVRFASSTSLLDIFDWRFKKYLTPWILRVTWVLVLVIAALWVFGNLLEILSYWLPAIDWGAGDEPAMGGVRPNVAPREPVLPRWLIELVIRFGRSFAGTLYGIAKIAVGAIALLLLRVVFEVAIVLFNIATSLTAIENKISEPTSSN